MSNTFETFITEASWHKPSQRPGQRYMNLLMDMRPDLAKMVRANDLDPFYLDERIPMFLEYVMRHWERPQA